MDLKSKGYQRCSTTVRLRHEDEFWYKVIREQGVHLYQIEVAVYNFSDRPSLLGRVDYAFHCRLYLPDRGLSSYFEVSFCISEHGPNGDWITLEQVEARLAEMYKMHGCIPYPD